MSCLFIIAAAVDCSISNNCTQGCAVVDDVEMCYCFHGYQLDTDAISCLGTYSMSYKATINCISIKQMSMNVI